MLRRGLLKNRTLYNALSFFVHSFSCLLPALQVPLSYCVFCCTDENRSIIYTNLPGGSYDFHYYVVDEYGQESEKSGFMRSVILMRLDCLRRA